MGKYFTFRILITRHIAMFLYVLGMIAIPIASFSLIEEVGLAFIVFLVGELLFRLLGEITIIQFSIQNELTKINKILSEQSGSRPAPVVISQQVPQPAPAPYAQPATAAPAQKYCSSCGAVVDAAFCSTCGSKVDN